MKCLLQRVTQASVTVAGEVVGEIDRGLLVLVGVEPEDTEQTVTRMAERLLRYRVFADPEGKMNLNVVQAGALSCWSPNLPWPLIPPAVTGRGSRPPHHPSRHLSCVMRSQGPCARVMSGSRRAVSAPTCRWRWSMMVR